MTSVGRGSQGGRFFVYALRKRRGLLSRFEVG